ncbi:fibrillin-1-like, partial [Centruroides sculpturatus]|uniref:fibrillin-1-like n=1 Tax=Centruroides sculpturatus TaxID=218467 RepID=UPI000C6E27F8
VTILKKDMKFTWPVNSPVAKSKGKLMPSILGHWTHVYIVLNPITAITDGTDVRCRFAEPLPKDNDVACDIIIIFKEEFKDYERINKGHSCYRAENATSNYCFLHPNLILSEDYLKTAEIVEFDNCDDRIRESFCPGVANTCISKQPGYKCSCNEGFKAIKTFYLHNTEYEFCEDIDECLDANKCGSNSNCSNTVGNFTCSCRDGYVRNKNKNEFECGDICELEKPCKNGKCNRLENRQQYKCQCDSGFTGLNCDEEDKTLKKGKVNTIITGAVLGGILFIAIIIIFVLERKLRKKSKNAEGFDTQMDNYERRFGDSRPVYENIHKGRKQGYDNPAM